MSTAIYHRHKLEMRWNGIFYVAYCPTCKQDMSTYRLPSDAERAVKSANAVRRILQRGTP